MADTQEAQPQQQTQPPADSAPKPAKSEKRPDIKPRKSLGRRIGEHPIKFVIFLIVLVAAGIAGYRFWVYLDSYESTDDAQIDGDIYAVTSRIAGTIKAVYVQDNCSLSLTRAITTSPCNRRKPR
jgi:membrane fusion protein, multidrug efflux system